VVCEALRIGVPVLASRISGNLGLLGVSYPGYFPLEDERALARLITRASSDAAFYRRLRGKIRELKPIVSPQAEARALLSALSGLPTAARAASRRAR
jgi:glycosyltransferase involved in cell wall biosynthesis